MNERSRESIDEELLGLRNTTNRQSNEIRDLMTECDSLREKLDKSEAIVDAFVRVAQ